MKLPNVLKRVRSRAGFTMIELLVVISVIGVLAVAVLSSINPIEQINKGRDTRLRSDAAQLLNAIDRYLAIHEAFPWTDSGEGPPDIDEAYAMTEAGWGAAAPDWVGLLEQTAEVKPGYVARLRDEARHVIAKPDGYETGSYVCFIPWSMGFRQEAMTKCADGSTDAANAAFGAALELCPNDADIDADNYICLP